MLKKLLFPAALLIAVAIPLWLVQELPGTALAPPESVALVAGPAPDGALDRARVTFQETPEQIAGFKEFTVDEDVAVLDGVLQRVFEGRKPRLDEASVLEVLRYVSQTTKLQYLNSARGSDCLAQGYGLGAGMAQALVALCQRMGFPARVNAFHNFGFMQGYNGAEVYYDGAWHFFDPTCGAFFYTEPEYNQQGRVPALRELLVNPALRQQAFMVSEPTALWTGNFDPKAGLRPLARDFVYGLYKFNLGELYDQIFSKSFPVAESNQVTASYPMDVDLRARDEVWVGAVDGDPLDMAGKQPDGRYPRYHGVLSVGPTRFGGAANLVTLLVREPGLYRITYCLAGESTAEGMSVTELRNVVAARTAATETTWSVEMYVQDTEGMLLITSPGKKVYVDAIHVERVAVGASGTPSAPADTP